MEEGGDTLIASLRPFAAGRSIAKLCKTLLFSDLKYKLRTSLDHSLRGGAVARQPAAAIKEDCESS